MYLHSGNTGQSFHRKLTGYVKSFLMKDLQEVRELVFSKEAPGKGKNNKRHLSDPLLGLEGQKPQAGMNQESLTLMYQYPIRSMLINSYTSLYFYKYTELGYKQ